MSGTFTNRVFDTVATDFVHWSTEPEPDITGVSYPGPGTFGVDTSDYTVSAKVPVSRNFSFKTVVVNSVLTIPVNQQMLVSGGFNVLGTVNLFGEIVLL